MFILEASAHEGSRPVQLKLELEKEEEVGAHDPFEPFNQAMFGFNRQVDHFVLKPVAIMYDAVLPDLVQGSLRNVFQNIGVVPRVVNNALQLKFGGMTRELSRFVLNSTVGIAGLFDFAKLVGVETSQEDTGQTLGVYGVAPGPYVVLPFLPPFTVRDGFGAVVDIFLNPLIYFAPFAATASIRATDTVNERSLNLELYEGVEEAALDLYTAVKDGYLQRRRSAISE
ncbi:MAG: VacJ family lipoprotein [Candidatus Methylomirabilia bacterium]